MVTAGAQPLEEGANGNGLSDPLGQSHQWLARTLAEQGQAVNGNEGPACSFQTLG